MAKTSTNTHYINNQEFLAALLEHRERVQAARAAEKDPPPISSYLGDCFIKIARHLSYKSNFINYSYRDEMISDAIENCLAVVNNFDPAKSKNPFAYFTQICYFAFIRRLQKEKKCQDIKLLYMENAGIEKFANFGEDGGDSPAVGEGIVERIRHKVEQIHQRDAAVKTFGKTIKKNKKNMSKNDSVNSLEFFQTLI